MRLPVVVLSAHAVEDDHTAALESAVAQGLCEAGAAVFVVPHLYHVAERSRLWKQLADEQPTEPMVVLSWLHPRPVEWLLHRHGLRTDRLTALNLATFATAEACLAAVRQLLARSGSRIQSSIRGRIVKLDESTSTRWYPIVDGSRCVNCHHCFQFCLFGVYVLDEDGKLQVRNPDQCKPGCPACSRICPEGAIVFPLYERDEAIAGAPGRFMSPDLPARRMFYTRTHQPCPVCRNIIQGQQPPSDGNGERCPECGGPRQSSASAATPPPAAFDDLDALVDQLDQVMHRKR